jgi:hypothetical protein
MAIWVFVKLIRDFINMIRKFVLMNRKAIKNEFINVILHDITYIIYLKKGVKNSGNENLKGREWRDIL